MNRRPCMVIRCIALMILSCVLLSGCTLFKRPEQKSAQTDGKKDPPKALTLMEQETEKIIKSIEDIRKEREKLQREQMKPSKAEGVEKQGGLVRQNEQQGQNEQDQKQQGQGQQSQNQQGEKGQQQGQQAEQPKMPVLDWNQIEKSVEAIHTAWNNFEPDAEVEGISPEDISGFEDRLNTLTEHIMSRAEEETLSVANELYSYYPEFMNLYKHKQPPEVKKMKFLARQMLLYGQQDKWPEAKALIADMRRAWQTAKARMQKKDEALNKKIDAAIQDFAYMIDKEKINLAQLKGQILLKNLEQIK